MGADDQGEFDRGFSYDKVCSWIHEGGEPHIQHSLYCLYGGISQLVCVLRLKIRASWLYEFSKGGTQRDGNKGYRYDPRTHGHASVERDPRELGQDKDDETRGCCKGRCEYL